LNLRSPLDRYRLLAYIVGTALVILVFIGIPLQVWGHNDTVEKIVGTIHGFLYIVYVVLNIDIAFRYKFSLLRAALSLLAGLVPIMTFVAERNNTAYVRARQAALAREPIYVPTSADLN
jgi:integral membrane protein